MYVADYSWARPSPLSLISNNFIGALRYIGPGNNGRDVTSGEIKRLHDAGLGVGLVWETTTTAALAGFNAGMGDAAAANRYADSVGFPDHLPIFIAVDTDVTPNQIRTSVADTFRGAIRDSKRPIRPYGEADVLDILCGELKLMPCGWQCAAWSFGKKSSYRCMFQTWPPIMNQSVDLNELGPMPLDFLWHPSITYSNTLESQTGGELTMADVEAVIAADTQNTENLAGVVREQTQSVRDDLQHALEAILGANAQNAENVANVVRGVSSDSVNNILAELKANGVISGDMDAAAKALVEKMEIIVKP